MRILSLWICLVLGGISFPARSEGRLEAHFQKIGLAAKAASGGEGGSLRFIMRNPGDGPVSYNIQGYPVPSRSGFFSNNLLLVVGPDGKEVAYIGPYVEFENDLRNLPAGQTIINEIDVAKNYAVEPGVTYQISLKYPPVYFIAPSMKAESARETARGQPHQVVVKGISESFSQRSISTSRSHRSFISPSSLPTDVACSGSQSDDFNSAMSIATAKVTEALFTNSSHYTFDLSTDPITTYFHYWSRFWRWFGAHQDPVPPDAVGGSDSQVDQRLLAVYTRMTGQTGDESSVISITCDCAAYSNDPVADQPFAYVFPNELYTIRLCPKFFTSPETASDPELVGRSKTIYHEFTHFDDFLSGGTVHVLRNGLQQNNMAQAEALVAEDPLIARTNTYNWVYFIQNWDNQ